MGPSIADAGTAETRAERPGPGPGLGPVGSGPPETYRVDPTPEIRMRLETKPETEPEGDSPRTSAGAW